MVWETKPSRSSYAPETRPVTWSQTKSSGHRESSEQPRSVEKASSKPIPESKISLRKESFKSSTIEQQSSPLPKMVSSGSTESSKTSTSREGAPSRENSIQKGAPSRENSLQKASHVHPKLPDYDTLAAHLDSLRLNRK
ncbi:hypothetical protein L1049_022955 [Liquidambar formosana]|uniref:Uncharacterized protein n=1 Tax=Liquidambar formosana TaxID=63359 RepID=A0AAP0RDE4_LIQFO